MVPWRGSLTALLLWLWAAQAVAQVHPGDFKLGLELDLFAYAKQTRTEGESVKTSGFGPAIQGGPLSSFPSFLFGYVAHRHLVPQLALSFGRRRTERDAGSSSEGHPTKVGALSIQPRLEVPLYPDKAMTSGLVMGVDLRRTRSVEISPCLDLCVESDDVAYGVGPVLGLATHFFATSGLSFDVGAFAQIDWLFEGEDDPYDIDPIRQVDVALRVGISGWL